MRDQERIEITVRLRIEEETLHRDYYLPPYEHLEEHDTSTAWESLLRGPGFGDLQGPEALATLLDRGSGEELATHLTRGHLVEAGELLFALLFGEASDWEPLLRRVFRQPSGPRPNPPRRAVRVRVVSDDPMLAGLPWRLTAWHAKWLLDWGWTFEAVTHETANGHVELLAPAKVLVVAPGCGEDTHRQEHLLDLRETLLKISPSYEDPSLYAEVEAPAQLKTALRGMQPHVLYYYGHGTVDGGQACLLLGEEGASPHKLSMNDLRRLLGDSPPRLLYLNACKSGVSGWHSAGHQLTPDVPCVVANRTTAWSGEAGALACRWFHHFLGQGLDPVVALHKLPADESTRGFQWATPVAWSSFKSWQTLTDIGPVPRREVGRRLDRDQQRALALKHVRDLLGSHARRVEAMVVYGAAGTLVEQFGSQARDYLESEGVVLRWLSRQATLTDELGFDHLEDELNLWLGRQDFEALGALLRRQAPDRGHSRSSPVLCLDWGVVNTRQHPQVVEDGLHEWLLFAAEELARDCPPEIRVLSYLGLEVVEEDHGSLEETMAQLQADVRSQKFRSSLLPVLGDVTLTNILDYLEDPSNTHCPPTQAREASQLIFRRTGGRYEETVKWIGQGEEMGWHRLLRQLRAE